MGKIVIWQFILQQTIIPTFQFPIVSDVKELINNIRKFKTLFYFYHPKNNTILL